LRKEEQGKRNLEALRGRQQTTIARLDKQRRGVAAESSRLLEKERRLAELLDHLYGRATAPLGGTPIQRFRGVLDWPARGPVEVAFGPRKDPTYQTVVPHNGLQIGTRVATEVRSIFPGKVLFADELEGYGTTIVVHHPGRVFTLFAGLQELEAAEDDVLSLGQVIGSSGRSLYFEIRVENRPEDPADWLR